jgi:hypothetical protein
MIIIAITAAVIKITKNFLEEPMIIIAITSVKIITRFSGKN